MQTKRMVRPPGWGLSIGVSAAALASSLATLWLMLVETDSIQSPNFATTLRASATKAIDVAAYQGKVSDIDPSVAIVYAGDADITGIRALLQTAVVIEFLPWLLTCAAGAWLVHRWARGTILRPSSEACAVVLGGVFLLAGVVAPWLTSRAKSGYLDALDLPRDVTEAEQIATPYFFTGEFVELNWIALAASLIAFGAAWALREARRRG